MSGAGAGSRVGPAAVQDDDRDGAGRPTASRRTNANLKASGDRHGGRGAGKPSTLGQRRRRRGRRPRPRRATAARWSRPHGGRAWRRPDWVSRPAGPSPCVSRRRGTPRPRRRRRRRRSSRPDRRAGAVGGSGAASPSKISTASNAPPSSRACADPAPKSSSADATAREPASMNCELAIRCGRARGRRSAPRPRCRSRRGGPREQDRRRG